MSLGCIPPDLFRQDPSLPRQPLGELAVDIITDYGQIAGNQKDLGLAVVQGNDPMVDSIQHPFRGSRSRIGLHQHRLAGCDVDLDTRGTQLPGQTLLDAADAKEDQSQNKR